MNNYSLIITCEHATNNIPSTYSHLFKNATDDLDSHLGWDPGAWDIAIQLGSAFGVNPIGGECTRLLIELNRSLNHPQLFSKYTDQLTRAEKDQLIETFYFPYRNRIEATVKSASKPVLHLSIHSFTPVWNGDERKVDIGLLFDLSRKSELKFCNQLKRHMVDFSPQTLTKFNEPYLGTDDGFTSYLRTKFSDEEYLGIEIEVNQKFATNLKPVQEILLDGLKKAIAGY